MQCDYYQQQVCRSCSRLPDSYEAQVAAKQADLLRQFGATPIQQLLPPITSPEQRFRNKAKMVVSGRVDAPILGIVDDQGHGQDLSACPLYPERFAAVFDVLSAFITRSGLVPYAIRERAGELKYVLLMQSQATQEFMLRFVLRSTLQLAAIKQHLTWLQQQLPDLTVISVNIQPAPMAIIEGEEEIVLTDQAYLYEEWNGVPLHIRPRSFFQTNPAVAAQLYATARDWSRALQPTRVWDLFCGVGGFGLHCVTPDISLIGIEISPEAIDSAQQSAMKMNLSDVTFMALPSAEFAAHQVVAPDLLIANPPRRGLGKALCEYIQALKPQALIYSSCHAKSLISDLQLLSDYCVDKVQLFDMFPHTDHYETLVLLTRK